MVEEREIAEDISFRNQIEPLFSDIVIDFVCGVLGVDKRVVYNRQRGSFIRPVAAQMLCKFAGLTQREVAGVLNLKSGVAVSCQLRKLHKAASVNEELKKMLAKISAKLQTLQNETG
jgi:hypothetical protein